MSPGSTSTASDSGEVLPGYFLEDKTGAWLSLPEFPLGEIPTIGLDVADWAESKNDYQEVPGPRHHLSGELWKFTRGQLRFVLWWYALRDDGRWLHRSGVKRGAKGTGKDPFLALLALAELVGPTRPVWDDEAKEWRGERHNLALVQIGANSETQGKDPLVVANAMVGREMKEFYGFDKGILRTQVEGGSKIEVLTSSEATAEGDPATAIFLNESHHMKESNGGQALAKVARRNVAKSPGGMARVCEFTNAHMPGEGSVAEDSYEAWQAQVSGKTKRQSILYDSREAPPHLRLHVDEELMQGLTCAYWDCRIEPDDPLWVDLEGLAEEALDLRSEVADSIRYYFSSLPTSEAAWIEPRKFDSLARPGMVVADKEPVALFLDCSKSEDATTLCGCRLEDGHVFALKGWQRPHGDRGKGWLAPREEADAEVRAAFDRWDVQWFGVDPSPARDDETERVYWMDKVNEWHRDFRDKVLVWATPGREAGNAVLFDMRNRKQVEKFTTEAEATALAIDEQGSLTWDGDSMLRLHTHNAQRRPNQFGVSLGKKTRDSKDLVDFAVSMVGARLGRRLVLNSGKTRKKRSGKVW